VPAVEAKLKNHTGFEASLTSSQGRLDATKHLGHNLIKENYNKKEAVQEKIGELDSSWTIIGELTRSRRAGLEKALAQQKALEDLRLQFATKARAFATWMEDVEDGEIAEPIKTQSLDAAHKLQANFNSFFTEFEQHAADYHHLVEASEKLAGENCFFFLSEMSLN